MTRLDAARQLQLLIAQIGDGLLDQAAIDRVKSATFGAIKREAQTVLRQREFAASQMKLEDAA